MTFLIDENLPARVGSIFKNKGFEVETVSDSSDLRGERDEVIFDYAANRGSVIVTRDLRFTDPNQFDLSKVEGIVVIRFPNDISISKLCDEMARLLGNLSENDFKQILVVEPGAIRIRPIYGR